MPNIRPGADCHAHVFCGPDYPLSREAVYRPDPSQAGTAAKFRAVLEAHGLTHGLLVGAGPYGPDNRCMIEAIAESRNRFKGIALVRSDISERELAALSAKGVVGIRINLFNHGIRPLVEPGAAQLLARVKELGWFVQVHCQKDELAEAAPILLKAGVRVMVDHFGRPDVTRGLSQLGFQTLLEFGRSGRGVVKLSGPFRCSIEGYPYRDVEPFIAAAIEAYTLDHCVWGSDWPFVRMDERMDYGPVVSCLDRWLPDEKDRRKLLWDNPKRLFGFVE
jgi:predicted TIM-barrel fold metal-dependent hydrolase